MTALVEQKSSQALPYSPDQIELIKNQICKGASDVELQLFLHVCHKTGLDPLVKQVYSVKYGTDRSIIVGIDGFRSVAERSGCYAPGKESTFSYDAQGRLKSATAYVKKMTRDGTWHEVSASAFWAEYGSDKQFWKKMPHVMLSKCAEAIALRKAFPNELSGLYTQDEMDQANRKSAPEEVLAVEAADVVVHAVEIEHSDEEVEKLLSKLVRSDFPKEDYDLMQEYILKYATHHKKSMWQAYVDYQDNIDKLRGDFSRWKAKHNKMAEVSHGK